MAHSYTPGLRVSKYTQIRKERRLPLRGTVNVKLGDNVAAHDIIAHSELPGNVHPLNCCGQLGILPADIDEALAVSKGSAIKKDQIIAQSSSFFGLFKNKVQSPIEGFLESASPITGQVILREKPIPVEVTAYIDGVVTEVYPDEGVEVESVGAFIQGIFGIGGERYGVITVVVNSPDQVLEASMLSGDYTGKILIAGRRVTIDAYRKAGECGAVAIVSGGFENFDLKTILGYEQGVAITGQEEITTTLILTEGFGDIAMATRTFELLKSHEGKGASVSGATQIRAGVIRPEVIIPLSADVQKSAKTTQAGLLEVGDIVRVIREPYFGKLVKVTDLPSELQELESGAKVRVLEAELDNRRVILPRANVEMIEE